MIRTSKNLKRIISLLAVVIILSSIAIVPVNAAYTPYWQRARAFIAAAITALNIQLESSTMSALDIVDYVVDPLEVNYTYVDAWADRPEIQIWDDYVTIDGVKYTDIWISNEAAEKFRVNAHDFKTAYQIASNSSGTFKSGYGDYDGVPVFQSGNDIVSQNYLINGYGTFDFGNGSVTISNRGGYDVSEYTPSNGSTYTQSQFHTSSVTPPYGGRIYNSPGIPRYGFMQNVDGNLVQRGYSGVPNNLLHYDPFDYDYVAQDIPANQPLPSDTGMMIRIPSEDSQGNKWLGDFLTDYPEFNQGEPVTIDINLDPDIMNKLDDLINIIAPIIPVINNNQGDVTFIENHDGPAPVQDSLLPDTWWSTLENKLDEIRQTIQNLTPDFSQIIQSIQTIPSAITQAVSNITQSISNLGDTILRDIEEGPIRLLDKLIDVLRSLFFPILATLRGFLGIWHYVVTWMLNISAPFTWIMGLMSGTSPILVSPIYALIAGIIVIAVYRRFGR